MPSSNDNTVVRAGVVAAVALAGVWYWYRRRQADVIPPLPPKPKKRGFTAEELSICTGTKGHPLYCSVKGVVYAVSPQFYGPGQAYHCFAGTECSRNLAKGIVGNAEANAEWRCLGKEHMEALDNWASTFESKYQVVGWFVPDDQYVGRGEAFENGN